MRGIRKMDRKLPLLVPILFYQGSYAAGYSPGVYNNTFPLVVIHRRMTYMRRRRIAISTAKLYSPARLDVVAKTTGHILIDESTQRGQLVAMQNY